MVRGWKRKSRKASPWSPLKEVSSCAQSPLLVLTTLLLSGLNTIITTQRAWGDVYFYPNRQHHHSMRDPILHRASARRVALLPAQLLPPKLSRAEISCFTPTEDVIGKLGSETYCHRSWLNKYLTCGPLLTGRLEAAIRDTTNPLPTF